MASSLSLHLPASTRLRSASLWFIRAGWLLVVVCAIYFAAALAPLYIRDAAQDWQVQGMEFAFQMPEALPPLPAAVKVAVYRIAAEAITNVVKHAQASRCEVGLVLMPASAGHATILQVDIWDNGRGIPADKPIGLGLRSMRERAEELNGSFSIESVAGQGTRVKASLPIL